MNRSESLAVNGRPKWLGQGSWGAKAWLLLKEQEAEGRLRPAERVKAKLEYEDWESLLKEMTLFAEQGIGRRYWRGQRGNGAMVLPEGHDAESVASEAALKALAGKSRVVLGWTRERLVRELQRLVSGELRRLNGLSEVRELRSEWDLLPPDEEGKPRSIFEEMMSEIRDGREELSRKEAEEELETAKRQITASLNGDGVARGLFGCLCDGVVKRREIAARLRVSRKAVTAGRKRLCRKLEEFGTKHPEYPREFIEELKKL